MSQRLTRKEIKHDDFADAMGRGVEYAESHVKTILYAVGGVLLLLALGVGVYFFLGRQAAAANEALAGALKVYQAPLSPTGAKPDDPKEPSFATEAARQARAKTLFEGIRNDYGSTDAGEVAAVYLGQIAAQEGQFDRAREFWTEFADDHKDHLLAGEVRLNLLSLDRKQGKSEEVVTRLRAMLEESEPPLPKDVVLHELGTTLEDLKRPQEALQTYQRILDDFPQSPYRQDAQQKVTALNPASAGAPGGLPAGLSFPG